MPSRELRHPVREVEDHDEGLLIRFYVSGSKFGAVEIVLALDAAEAFATDLLDAICFQPLCPCLVSRPGEPPEETTR